MAATFESVGSVAYLSASGDTELVVDMPSGVAVGDLLVMAISTNGRACEVAGWELSIPATAPTTGINLVYGYRVADGTEGGTVTVTFLTGSNYGTAAILRFSGAGSDISAYRSPPRYYNVWDSSISILGGLNAPPGSTVLYLGRCANDRTVTSISRDKAVNRVNHAAPSSGLSALYVYTEENVQDGVPDDVTMTLSAAINSKWGMAIVIPAKPKNDNIQLSADSFARALVVDEPTEEKFLDVNGQSLYVADDLSIKANSNFQFYDWDAASYDMGGGEIEVGGDLLLAGSETEDLVIDNLDFAVDGGVATYTNVTDSERHDVRPRVASWSLGGVRANEEESFTITAPEDTEPGDLLLAVVFSYAVNRYVTSVSGFTLQDSEATGNVPTYCFSRVAGIGDAGSPFTVTLGGTWSKARGVIFRIPNSNYSLTATASNGGSSTIATPSVTAPLAIHVATVSSTTESVTGISDANNPVEVFDVPGPASFFGHLTAYSEYAPASAAGARTITLSSWNNWGLCSIEIEGVAGQVDIDATDASNTDGGGNVGWDFGSIAYTSQRSGNWTRTSDNADSPWYDGGSQSAAADYPRVGDTVTIANGHTVTVDSDVSVGTLPQDNTTNVLTIGASGAITIAEDQTLTVLGNWAQGGTLTLQAGSSFLLDCAAGMQHYRGQLVNWQTLRVNGTAAKPCTYGSNSTTYIDDTSFLNGSSNGIEATYCTFQNLGGVVSAYSRFYCKGSAVEGNSVTHCTFDNCYSFTIVPHTVYGFTFTDNVFKNSRGSYCFNCYIITDLTTGTRDIKRNVFDISCFLPCAGATIEGNYFGGNVNYNIPNAITSFADNFQICEAMTIRYSLTDSYLFAQGQSNAHHITAFNQYRSIDIADNVFHMDNASTSSDCIIYDDTGDLANLSTCRGNVFLPNAGGTGCGTLFQYADSGDNTRVEFLHNTCVVSNDGESGVCVGYSDLMESGKLEKFLSNLFHTPSGQTPGFKAWRATASTKQDLIDPSYIDYNWSSNLAAGSEGNGFQDLSSTNDMFTVATSTLDTNGGSGDPQFVDETRSVVLYDTAAWGLNNPAATPWADATSYAVGDMVSAATAGFYGGATINYRCITAHTSNSADSTDGKPGSAASFRTNWEYVALYRLREDPTRIPTMIAAVRAGFAPQNPALRDAGHDGVTIGALEYAGADVIMAIIIHHRRLCGMV